ncbi:ATPase, T2SS/T4P/T4SS family [Natronoarchaeum rubrum]|uniref:ATPase, T2SS/T4P/T4SS family n=1 Tax=Natronoarchaeum rubrum TaxID=755311 RepID=UPI0035C1DC98
MAIDDADQSGSGRFDGADESATSEDDGDPSSDATPASVGGYTWADFMEEFGYGNEISELYPERPEGERLGLEAGPDDEEDTEPEKPSGDDWNRVQFDPVPYLGFHPDELGSVFGEHEEIAEDVDRTLWEYIDPVQTPCTKDVYEWEHFKQEFYYEGRGTGVEAPREDGEKVPFEPADHLGFEPEDVEDKLFEGNSKAEELADLVDERTVNVEHEAEDEFFSTVEGHTTVVNRYDLEKAVPMEKKTHFREENRYWVNKPYAFVILFHSEKENEKKYYAVEPYLNEIELDLQDFLTGKLRTAIKYNDDDIATAGDDSVRKDVIDRETKKLLQRYDLFTSPGSGSGDYVTEIKKLLGRDVEPDDEDDGGLHGIEARPEVAVLEDDPETLTEYQVEKLLYLLKRNFIGYERIDPIKHDINVEDISCDGYNSPVFVYHSDYEQIITNIYHGEEELDDFVVKLAQRSGKGISKRRPQVDATLPDGSRSQLTLGREVSDHGTNYTIRQFKDVPFTPIDLINWKTFSLDEMAFLWLCIENHKSLIFAGGTASGKTTSLNAVSLFIPSNTKIVSIEDTREVELPQRNWIASITRPSFSDDSQGDVDEFDLLEAALRQRPDYIVMGEIRGEEGRTLFQVMSTGHTTYTTFHADSVGEVLKRFTTAPINVSKTMFTALDLVSIQTQTRVQGHKVRRNKVLTEVNHYDAENDEINVQDVYQWQAETDEFLKMGESNTLEEIKFDRGWGQERLDRELEKRRVILAYLIENGLNEYAQVAATIQAFINDPETILTLIANGVLEDSLEDLREMESVLIDVDPEKEELVPRPDPNEEGLNEVTDILERAEESILQKYKGKTPSGLASALDGVDAAAEPELTGDDEGDEFEFGGSAPDDDAFGIDNDEISFGDDGEDVEEPDWFSDEGGFFFDDGTEADASGEDVAPEARDAIDNLDTDTAGEAADAAGTGSESTPAIEGPDGADAAADAGAESEPTDDAEPQPALEGETISPDAADAESTASETGLDGSEADSASEPAGTDTAAGVSDPDSTPGSSDAEPESVETGTEPESAGAGAEPESAEADAATELDEANAPTESASAESEAGSVFGDDHDDGGVFGDDPDPADDGSLFDDADDGFGGPTTDDFEGDADGPFGDDATAPEPERPHDDESGADEPAVRPDAESSADRPTDADPPDSAPVDAESSDADPPETGPQDAETPSVDASAEPAPDAETSSAPPAEPSVEDDASDPAVDAGETPDAADASASDEDTDRTSVDPSAAESMFEADEGGDVFSDADAEETDAPGSIFDEIDSADDDSIFTDVDEDDTGDDGPDKQVEGFEYVDFDAEDGDD